MRSMQQYQHIIWDWNGTLLDDAWLCREIINDMLAQRGLPEMTAERYAEVFDFPVEGYYRAVGFDFARESFATLAAEFMGAYDRRWRECGLQPEARAALAAAGGATQSVLSAMHHGRLTVMVEHFALHEHFQSLVGLENYYAHGKEAQGRRHIADLGCDPRDVLLIGDTLHDHAVAAAMGIDCVLLPCGHFSRPRLTASGARVLDGHADVRNLIQRRS